MNQKKLILFRYKYLKYHMLKANNKSINWLKKEKQPELTNNKNNYKNKSRPKNNKNNYKNKSRPKINKKFYKTELCWKMIEYGHCDYGDNCEYAHNDNELRERFEEKPSSYKRVLCKKYWEGVVCPYGKKCKFIHEFAEYNVDKNDKDKLDPKYRTKECDTYNKYGKCPYGNTCKFIHKIKRQNSEDDFINNSLLFKWTGK